MLQIGLMIIHMKIHDNNKIHQLTMSNSTRAQTDRPTNFSLCDRHGILLSFSPSFHLRYGL